jgi:hypothetical protein
MTSTSILDAIQQQLSPDVVRQMSEQLGADPAATSTAISSAIPALIGGLAHNASSPEGAADLSNALDAHDGGILGNLGALLGGGSAGGIGGAILGHILGARRGPVEQGVGQASGMSAQQVGQLLMMLAPLVMGVLGRMKKEDGVGAQQLPEVLGQSNGATGALGGILDRNHDGSIADDVTRMGTSVLGGLFGNRS